MCYPSDAGHDRVAMRGSLVLSQRKREWPRVVVVHDSGSHATVHDSGSHATGFGLMVGA